LERSALSFSKIVLLGQLFYNDNKKPVLVKIKGYELIEPSAKLGIRKTLFGFVVGDCYEEIL